MDYSHTQLFSIRTHEIDQSRKLTVPALVYLMQEASMQNVIRLKASVWDMEGMKVSWVLLRKELTIYRLPALGEKVRILTYPAGFDRVFAFRDYKAYDEQGHPIAQAGSTWTLMHTESRKMVRIPAEFFSFDMADSQDILPRPKSKIPIMESMDEEREYAVKWYDLDWNGHVNNVYIIRSVVEAVPDHFLLGRELKQLTIHFRAESLWKDQLLFRYQRTEEDTLLHSVVRKSDGKLVTSGMSTWTKV